MKTLKAVLLVCSFLLSVGANADDGSILGTSVLLDSRGVFNVYYQVKANESAAFVGSVATTSGDTYYGSNVDAIGYSLSYKNYFGRYYASGGYLELGAASTNVRASSEVSKVSVGSSFSYIIVAGYEKTLGKGLVVGAEVGVGAAHGWSNLALNIGVMF